MIDSLDSPPRRIVKESSPHHDARGLSSHNTSSMPVRIETLRPSELFLPDEQSEISGTSTLTRKSSTISSSSQGMSINIICINICVFDTISV